MMTTAAETTPVDSISKRLKAGETPPIILYIRYTYY